MCLLSENIRPNIMPPPGQGPMSPIPPGLQVGNWVEVKGHCFMDLHDLTCEVIQIFPNGEVTVHYPANSNPADEMRFTVRGDRLTIIEPPQEPDNGSRRPRPWVRVKKRFVRPQEPDNGSFRPRRTLRVPNHFADYLCGKFY